MHLTACTLVTHFCNPDLFSNSHGLLSAYLQCKSKKKKTSQTLKRKFLRFLSKQNLNSVSSAKVGETVNATLIKTEANPVTGESADLRLVCFAQAQNLPQSISPVSCAVKSTRQRPLLGKGRLLRAAHSVRNNSRISKKRFSLKKA